METLRLYQKEAVDKILDFFISDMKKAKIYLATGVGKTLIIATVIKELIESRNRISIAVLCSRYILCEQMISTLLNSELKANIATNVFEFSNQNILITTYQDVFMNQLEIEKFDLFICYDARFLKVENYFNTNSNSYKSKFLGILENYESTDNWFSDSKSLYSYMLKDAIIDGYTLYNSNFTQDFLIQLLKYYDYTNLSQEVNIGGQNSGIIIDILAKKKKEILVFETKFYRGLHNSEAIVPRALMKVLQYQELIQEIFLTKKVSFIIVLPCEIDENIQTDIFFNKNITIWDIKNLIYLCNDDTTLLNTLMRYTPYPSLDIMPKEPIGFNFNRLNAISDQIDNSIILKYVQKLKNCKVGKSNHSDREYELICTEIITYLFGTEFFKISKQHNTEDKMFRMDLLCSLKGTTEFWKFLISFYRTKFVVFEFKNYDKHISQNLIYVTEKYLFPIALRNVAFIISRKGFDSNAEKAALGCLKENGKLIVSLTDEDLIKMLYMKENGEEPSDYLLSEIEELLMAVSK